MTHHPVHRGHNTFECSCGHQPHPTCVDELSAVLDHCYIAAGIVFVVVHPDDLTPIGDVRPDRPIVAVEP